MITQQEIDTANINQAEEYAKIAKKHEDNYAASSDPEDKKAAEFYSALAAEFRAYAKLQQKFVPKVFCSHCGHETDGPFYCSDECREECCNLG